MNFDWNSIVLALIGGALIGLAASLLLIFSGRVAGVSGIVFRSLSAKGDRAWRWTFLLGLFAGGFALHLFYPQSVTIPENYHFFQIVLAGLLVGFGSALGNGCTSGHGVCGISRLSMRSILATMSFMASGAIMVFVLRNFFGGL